MSHLGIEALGIKINVTGLSDSEAAVFSNHWNCCVSDVHEDPQLSIARKPILWAKAYEQLTQQVTRQAIEANLGKLMMFHASGLQFTDSNEVIGFVAPSGTGKSTLTTALGKNMVYVSDEVLAVDKDLSVIPLQKPISLIGRSEGSFKGHLGPKNLGLLTQLTSSPRLASLFILNRVRESIEPSVSPLPLEQALVKLVPQVSGLGLIPSGLDAMCRIIEKLGGSFELTYSNAADLTPDFLANAIHELRGRVPLTWEHVQQPDISMGGRKFESVQSINFDAVEVNGHALILDRGQIRMLGALASAVWLAIPQVTSKAELLEILETRFGPHDESEKILDQVLTELKLQELLTDLQDLGHSNF